MSTENEISDLADQIEKSLDVVGRSVDDLSRSVDDLSLSLDILNESVAEMATLFSNLHAVLLKKNTEDE